MQRLTFCLLIIFGLVFGGCENNTEDTNTPGSGGPYTVTFATFTSGTIPSQTVTKGGKVSTVNPPTATNATFGGWYKNGGIDTWDFSTDVVTGNITLCAGWEFTSIDGVTTFLGSATAAEEPSAARHTTQGVDPNPGKLPIPVGVNIQLTRQNWANLVKGIESKNKKVSLDLTNS
ncbi:MAG: InlB B-repeat-containing protein, partial [Treponema sp.]|nr:InlB B-repeat-containing protein [Treponema sp.]